MKYHLCSTSQRPRLDLAASLLRRYAASKQPHYPAIVGKLTCLSGLAAGPAHCTEHSTQTSRVHPYFFPARRYYSVTSISRSYAIPKSRAITSRANAARAGEAEHDYITVNLLAATGQPLSCRNMKLLLNITPKPQELVQLFSREVVAHAFSSNDSTPSFGRK